MKENTQEKSLQSINKKSVFYKIKMFFEKLFHKEKTIILDSAEIIVQDKIKSNKNDFFDNLKIDNNTELLNLQKQLQNNVIAIKDLTEEQLDNLIDLYKQQISSKKEKLSTIKHKILSIRKRLENSTN